MKITVAEIELSVVRHFWRCFVVPNVNGGWRNLSYEIDMLIVTESDYAYEVEIKVSPGDLKRDAKKARWNYCLDRHDFRRSYFAMPETMLAYQEYVPAHAGIIAVTCDQRGFFSTKIFRESPVDTHARKVTDSEMIALGRLCMFRYWNQERANWRRQQQAKVSQA